MASIYSVAQYLLFIIIVTVLVKPSGGYVERVFSTSSFANNGQNFAGLSANTPFYNLTTALAMIVGRFGLALPALALAALFGRQRNTPASSGTLPTHHFVFGLLLTACLTTIAALSYLPGLALGPILERLQLGN